MSECMEDFEVGRFTVSSGSTDGEICIDVDTGDETVYGFIEKEDVPAFIEAVYRISGVSDCKQLVSEKAISYLFENHPEIYDKFYELV